MHQKTFGAILFYSFRIHLTKNCSHRHGPTVDFTLQAARAGNYAIELSQPNWNLQNRSSEYFGRGSIFDFCIYNTALGFLDMCVAQYTITSLRGSSADWFLLDSQTFYMILNLEAGEPRSYYQQYAQDIRTIFDPFEDSTWYFIFYGVIPIIGIFNLIHEYGKRGGSFPKTETVREVDQDGTPMGGRQRTMERKIPLISHLFKSVYIAYLSTLTQEYRGSVTTLGAKLNLIGFTFFILTLIAVYTGKSIWKRMNAVFSHLALNFIIPHSESSSHFDRKGETNRNQNV